VWLRRFWPTLRAIQAWVRVGEGEHFEPEPGLHCLRETAAERSPWLRCVNDSDSAKGPTRLRQ
jgi:hypothetical protein